MNKSDLEFYLKDNIVLSIDNFIISIVVAAILSFIVQLFYIKFSSTISNRLDFSKNFVILGIVTTIVITIVKSSLALSLGLVGALSIVRFRAAIKEPEELVFLFLIIAIGLGCGAGQIKIIIIGILSSLILIYLYYLYYKNKKFKIAEVLNLALSKNSQVDEKEINEIVDFIKSNSKTMDLISISKSKDDTTLNFDISVDNIKKINQILIALEKRNYKSIVARNDINSI
tara:strand:- start:1470 stop:2156 length:687 start_codon:yes stop_codon:yes gene_type:complete